MLRAKSLSDKIESEVAVLKSISPFTPEIKTLLDKKFRLEFNYNSNHLEGNTLTYNETELLLIFDQTDGGHEYREYQEMQAHDVTLLMIQQEAEDKERPLTEQFIRNLNEHLLVKEFYKDAITADGQKTRKKIVPGQYKTTPNSVQLQNGEIFHYTTPDEVSHEMASLVEWFNKNKDQIDSITLAATLHYKFVRIHPFDDGNGRTARLLMNYALLRNQLPIIIIKSAEKKEYLGALNRADAGDMNHFIDYIGNQLLWSLDISIKAAKGESIEESNDLDKELELLQKELHQIPDEFDKKKSQLEISNIFDNSIYPLIEALDDKLKIISSLFVEIDIQTIISERLNASAQQSEYSLEQFYSLFERSSPFAERNVTSIAMKVVLTALKKVKEPLDINYRLGFSFESFHCIIYELNNRDNVLFKIPYGRNLSVLNINSIVNTTMRQIINDVRSAVSI